MSGMNLFQCDTTGSDPSFMLNGDYWMMLSYCSAIGGCLLYVGTLAGHAVIDIQNVRLSWYIRHVFWRVLVAWGAGMLVFWLING